MSVLLIDKQGPITTLTLNRPERMNALGDGLGQAINDAIVDFSEDPGQRVMIITGAGEKAFCAGADLKEMKNRQDDAEARSAKQGSPRLPMARAPDMNGLAACEKPVIAAVNGLAIGGGLELAICSDIRVASDNAWFQTPEMNHGFLAGVAVSNLPRLMPFGAVMDLMVFGERLEASDAFRLGLVQEVTRPEALMDAAMRRAERIANTSQSALWGTKKVLRFWRDLMLAEHHRYYESVVHRVLLSGDMFEGVRAFNEKRERRFDSGWPDPFAHQP